MPNQNRAYNPIYYSQQALLALKEELVLASQVFQGYSKSSAQRGDTIRVKGPASFVSQTQPGSSQDADTTQVDITVDQWEGVTFEIRDDDLNKTQRAFIDDHIRPAALAVSRAVDASLRGLFLDIPHEVGGSSPAAITDVTGVRKALQDNGVPARPRFLAVGPAYEEELLQLDTFHNAGTAPDPEREARGFLGRKFGFDVFSQNSVPSHTAGSTNANAVAGAASAGDTSITLDDGSATATGDVNEGDILEIDGDRSYTITADANTAGGFLTVSIAPALESDVADNTAVTVVQNSGSVHMGAHRDAFALAMAPLPDIGDGNGAAVASIQDPETQLAMRSRLWYDADNAAMSVGVDALWGVETLNRDLACRLTV